MHPAETRAREACHARFGEPEQVASAPGRVNLVGGHTDYNDGFVLPVAIDRRTAVAVRPREDRTVRVHTAASDQTVTFPLETPDPGEPRWADYPKGVAWALDEAGHDLRGADLAIAGDVPVGAGLASSAALEVATAFALLGVADDAPETDSERRALARACQRAEREFVGVDCGILDQFAVTLCARDSALFLDCRTEATERVPLAPDVSVLVVDTTVTHELVDSAYDERRAECERGAALFADLLAHDVDALRDVSPAEFERHAGSLPEPVRSRCRHAVGENERVKRAVAALRDGALETVGRLMDESHASLRDDYEVSCPELDLVVDLLDRSGVHGARMTGAGFGGCVVALVDADAVESVASDVATEYETETGIEPGVYVCEASDGARLIGTLQ